MFSLFQRLFHWCHYCGKHSTTLVRRGIWSREGFSTVWREVDLCESCTEARHCYGCTLEHAPGNCSYTPEMRAYDEQQYALLLSPITDQKR